MASLFLLISVLSFHSIIHHYLAMDITVFIQYEPEGLHILEIPINITVSELYQKVPGLGLMDLLSIRGRILYRSSDNAITGFTALSIPPESVIKIIRGELSDAECLYRFAKDLGNRRYITWWIEAFQCHRTPQTKRCEPQRVCKWDGIRCDESQNAIIYVSLHTVPSIAKITGIIVPRTLPQTVVTLKVKDQRLKGVDLNGLTDSDLQNIDLSGNAIKQIELGELTGSSVKRLVLSRNRIFHLETTGLLKGRNELRSLDLSHNEIAFVNLNALSSSKDDSNSLSLRYLDLSSNRIATLSHDDFIVLQNSKTCIKMKDNDVLVRIVKYGFQGYDAPRRNVISHEQTGQCCCM